MKSGGNTFHKRLEAHMDELKWLYCELYHNDENAFRYFVEMLHRAYGQRSEVLRALDAARLENPGWYRSNDLLGMCLYTEQFAGTLNGVREKLSYLQEAGVNYLHLMPLLQTVKGRSDGGYAVADFRRVQPELGTMEDLEALTAECHRRGMACCLDFVMKIGRASCRERV